MGAIHSFKSILTRLIVLSIALSPISGFTQNQSSKAPAGKIILTGIKPNEYVPQPAFHGIEFDQPVSIVQQPRVFSDYFILERGGKVKRLQTGAESVSVFLDISSQVAWSPQEENGAVGIVFHPLCGVAPFKNNYLYLFYTALESGKPYYRVSRFTVNHEGASADPASEKILIQQLNEHHAHNGGALQFGPDGFLYISVGDEGEGFDILRNSQKVDKDLFSGILRIDVDNQGGELSHPIKTQPQTGATQDYSIPNDNPFCGLPHALEEFWAIGLRNPYRMTFDRKTGQIYAGDVGQESREEIEVIEKGSNHRWRLYEGDILHRIPRIKELKLGKEKKALFEYPHDNLDGCIIGGYVYRGKKYPDLYGKYIYADNLSGRVWALEIKDHQAGENRELFRVPWTEGRISSFGENNAGELFICTIGAKGMIYSFEKQLDLTEKVPQKLSETGLFADTAGLVPHSRMIPYEINQPFWSDGALKQRWIVMPENQTEKITFQKEGEWKFPAGTMFVKHFDIVPDQRAPETSRRLETRVLILNEQGDFYGRTYRWDETQTDAFLIENTVKAQLDLTDQNGNTVQQEWLFPGRFDCLICHNQNAGVVLGVKTRQLNRDVIDIDSGALVNQIHYWNELNRFSTKLTSEEIAALPKHTPVLDQTQDLDQRVKSYLDVNCSYCHYSGTPVYAKFDARAHVSAFAQQILYSKPGKNFGIEDAKIVAPSSPQQSILFFRMKSLMPNQKMPPLGHYMVDDAAVSVIEEWIHSKEATDDSLLLEGESIEFDFLNSKYEYDLLSLMGYVAHTPVFTPTPEGLEINLSERSSTPITAGQEARIKVEGDFDITAEYEILDLPKPGGGYGAGLTLTISDESDRWLSFQRVRATDDRVVYITHLAVPEGPGKHHHMSDATPTTAMSGKLRLQRRGNVLSYLVAEEGANEFALIKKIEFSKDPLKTVQFLAQNGNHPNKVRVLLKGFSITADQLPDVDSSQKISKSQDDKTVFPGPVFWAIWLCVPVLFLVLWQLIARVCFRQKRI